MNPYASNPYTDQMVKQTEGDIAQAYQQGVQPSLMAQFNAGGAYGGSAHQQALQGAQDAYAHQLAEASTGIRAQQADAQRDAWNQLMARQQAALDANYGQYLDQRNFKQSQIDTMTRALGSIMGSSGSSSSTGPNPNYTSAGQNAATWATIIASMYD
jgi:hypothetical protein